MYGVGVRMHLNNFIEETVFENLQLTLEAYSKFF